MFKNYPKINNSKQFILLTSAIGDVDGQKIDKRKLINIDEISDIDAENQTDNPNGSIILTHNNITHHVEESIDDLIELLREFDGVEIVCSSHYKWDNDKLINKP